MNLLIKKSCSDENSLILQKNVDRYVKSLGFKATNHGLILVCVPFLHFLFQRLQTKILESTPNIDKTLVSDFLPSEQFLLSFQDSGILLIGLKPLTIKPTNKQTSHYARKTDDELWINGVNIFLPKNRIKSIKHGIGSHKLIIINNVFNNNSLHKIVIKAIKMRHLSYSKANQKYIKSDIKNYNPVNKSFNKKSLKSDNTSRLTNYNKILNNLAKACHINNTSSIVSAHFNIYTPKSYLSPKQNFGDVKHKIKEQSPATHTKLQACLTSFGKNRIFIYQNSTHYKSIPYSSINHINASKYKSPNNYNDICIYLEHQKKSIFIRVDGLNSSKLPNKIQKSHMNITLPEFISNHCHTMMRPLVWQSCYKTIKHWNH